MEQTREITVNVAVLLAANRDLDQAVPEGTLRADFYDRFRTLAIRLLPLRELTLSRLEQHGGNVKAARESLGLTKTTFHRAMKRLRIATGEDAREN